IEPGRAPRRGGDGIIAGATGEIITAGRAADYLIVACASEDPIGVCAANKTIVSGAAENIVAEIAARNRVALRAVGAVLVAGIDHGGNRDLDGCGRRGTIYRDAARGRHLQRVAGDGDYVPGVRVAGNDGLAAAIDRVANNNTIDRTIIDRDDALI